MTRILLSPIDLSGTARKVGNRLYRKQVLPITQIDYNGQKITFDRAYLRDLANAFKANAYDQVPFILANAKNQHHEDPRYFEGEVKSLELTDDGLDAVVELTPEGEALIQKNPKLGVSARIMEGLGKSDGRFFKRAIRHVLATMDPKIVGLRPWQAVDLSAEHDNSEVVDLTAETYQGRITEMAKTKAKVTLSSVDAKSRTATVDLSQLSDDEFEAMLNLSDEEDEVEIDPETGKPVIVDDEETDEDEEGDEEGDEEEEVPAPVAKSTPKKKKVTVEEESIETSVPAPALASTVSDLSVTVATFQSDLARSRWETQRNELSRKGVPPFLLDLAEPVLASRAAHVIDLTAEGGAKVDAKDTISKMLEGYAGMVDLTPEMGHSIDMSDLGEKTDPDKAYLDEWEATYGS